MKMDIDFDPGKVPLFIKDLPTWQRFLAWEIYDRSVSNFKSSEEEIRNRKAVELFWSGEPVQRPPYAGRYRIDHALGDFAKMDLDKEITVVCTGTDGKPYLQTEIPLGVHHPGGLTVEEFHVMMRHMWEQAGNFFRDWRFSFTTEERNPKSASSWIVRLHPKDYICSDGVWNTVTERWCELSKKNGR